MVSRLVFAFLVVGCTVCLGCEEMACFEICENQYEECLAHRDPGVPGDPCGALQAQCQQSCDVPDEDSIVDDP
jgi:hypothetical protein